MLDFTFLDRLARHVAERPEKVVYTFLPDDGEPQNLTFGELDAQTRALAARLLERAQPGDRALLLYPSGLSFIVAFVACLRAGIVAVPSSTPQRYRSLRRVQSIVADCQPSLLLTETSLLLVVEEFAAQTGSNEKIVATDVLTGESDAVLPEMGPDVVAFIQYTSGSTGEPKGVIVTHGNLWANLVATQNAWNLRPESVVVGWLPMFHDMGLVGKVLQVLCCGGHSVLMAPQSFLRKPARWLQAITTYGGTCATAPNFGWDYCARLRDDEKAGLDLSSLETAGNGSEPVRAATLERFSAAFADCGFRREMFFPCYGMAETTLFVSGGPVEKAPPVLWLDGAALDQGRVCETVPQSEGARALVGCGQVGENIEVVIAHPDTSDETAQVGEIWVGGSSVAHGYWKRPELTAEIFGAHLSDGRGPFLRTGDLGFLHQSQVYVTGRLKDLMIIRGRNLYPQDVEMTVERVWDWVKTNTCAAFSLEKEGVEQLALVVEADRSHVREARVANGGRLPELELAISQLRHAIGEEHEVALHTVVLVKTGSFPRTTSGKVQRSRCRDLLLKGELDVICRSDLSGTAPENTPLENSQSPTFRHSEGSGSDPKNLKVTGSATLDSSGRYRSPLNDGSREKADAMIGWFRNYAARRLNSRVMDERRTIPPYVVLDLGNRGFLGKGVPESYGGAALCDTDQFRVTEQIAGVDVTLALMVGIHNGLGLRPLIHFGSETQKQQWLPTLAAGRQLAAFALTEAGAGSNPKAMSSSATRVAGGWRVNAKKKWIGLASWAGLITLFVQAHDESGRPLGLLALLVPGDTAGLSHGEESLTMGVRGIVQNTVFLRDAFIPAPLVLGEPGQGFAIAQNAMMFCRLGIASIALGGLKRCAQLMARYAERREVGTGRLIDNPVTRARLGELGDAINAVETLLYGFSGELDAGETLPDAAYIAAKVAGPELLGHAVDEAMQLLGGRGYEETSVLPQLMRDARLLRIFEGPTEALTMHLGMTILQRASGWREFVGARLGAPEVAEEVISLGETLRARPTQESEAVALQAAAFATGEVALAAILLAAAQRYGAQRATIDWARQRYETQSAAALAERGTLASTGELLEMVRGYASSIGDVEQTLPGEQTAMDGLLQREIGTLEAGLTPPSNQGFSVPSLSNSALPRLEGGVSPASPLIPSSRLEENASSVQTTSVTLVHDIILNYLREELKLRIPQIDPDAHFSTLGLDSVGLLAIAAELEEKTGHYLPEEMLYQFGTIRAMSGYLDSLAPPSPRQPRAPESVEFPEAPVQRQTEKTVLMDSLPVAGGENEGSILWSRYRQGLVRLEALKQRGNYFFHSPISEQSGSWVVINGQRMLMMGSNWYVGLSNHPFVVEAAAKALQKYGIGTHGSRLIAGTTALHEEVEAKLAVFMSAEDAIVYSSGFMTNLATISTLVGRGDCVIGDEWSHASIVDGCKASLADFQSFGHNDMAALETRLREAKGRATLVVVDAVFSMEGDVADLPRIVELCHRYGALLMVDEAHSLGVIGRTGRGIQEHFGLPSDAVDVKMTTFSKSLASIGGAVAGKRELIDFLRHAARGYLFSAALPAPQLAAVSAALDLLQNEPKHIGQLRSATEQYRSGLHKLGFDTFDSETPILPIRCPDENTTLAMTRLCRESGLFVVPVFYPAVPMNAPRLRTCVMATHTEADIDFALQVLADAGRKTGIIA